MDRPDGIMEIFFRFTLLIARLFAYHMDASRHQANVQSRFQSPSETLPCQPLFEDRPPFHANYSPTTSKIFSILDPSVFIWVVKKAFYTLFKPLEMTRIMVCGWLVAPFPYLGLILFLWFLYQDPKVQSIKRRTWILATTIWITSAPALEFLECTESGQRLLGMIVTILVPLRVRWLAFLSTLQDVADLVFMGMMQDPITRQILRTNFLAGFSLIVSTIAVLCLRNLCQTYIEVNNELRNQRLGGAIAEQQPPVRQQGVHQNARQAQGQAAIQRQAQQQPSVQEQRSEQIVSPAQRQVALQIQQRLGRRHPAQGQMAIQIRQQPDRRHPVPIQHTAPLQFPPPEAFRVPKPRGSFQRAWELADGVSRREKEAEKGITDAQQKMQEAREHLARARELEELNDARRRHNSQSPTSPEEGQSMADLLEDEELGGVDGGEENEDDGDTTYRTAECFPNLDGQSEESSLRLQQTESESSSDDGDGDDGPAGAAGPAGDSSNDSNDEEPNSPHTTHGSAESPRRHDDPTDDTRSRLEQTEDGEGNNAGGNAELESSQTISQAAQPTLNAVDEQEESSDGGVDIDARGDQPESNNSQSWTGRAYQSATSIFRARPQSPEVPDLSDWEESQFMADDSDYEAIPKTFPSDIEEEISSPQNERPTEIRKAFEKFLEKKKETEAVGTEALAQKARDEEVKNRMEYPPVKITLTEFSELQHFVGPGDMAGHFRELTAFLQQGEAEKKTETDANKELQALQAGQFDVDAELLAKTSQKAKSFSCKDKERATKQWSPQPDLRALQGAQFFVPAKNEMQNQRSLDNFVQESKAENQSHADPNAGLKAAHGYQFGVGSEEEQEHIDSINEDVAERQQTTQDAAASDLLRGAVNGQYFGEEQQEDAKEEEKADDSFSSHEGGRYLTHAYDPYDGQRSGSVAPGRQEEQEVEEEQYDGDADTTQDTIYHDSTQDDSTQDDSTQTDCTQNDASAPASGPSTHEDSLKVSHEEYKTAEDDPSNDDAAPTENNSRLALFRSTDAEEDYSGDTDGYTSSDNKHGVGLTLNTDAEDERESIPDGTSTDYAPSTDHGGALEFLRRRDAEEEGHFRDMGSDTFSFSTANNGVALTLDTTLNDNSTDDTSASATSENAELEYVPTGSGGKVIYRRRDGSDFSG